MIKKLLVNKIAIVLSITFLVGIQQTAKAQSVTEYQSLRGVYSDTINNSTSDATEKVSVNYFQVMAVNNNIVQLEGGITVDISDATNEIDNRSMEVGDKVFVDGSLINDPNFSALIKAERFAISKSRDVEINGVVQQVNGDSIVVLNQKILINSNTLVFGAEKQLQVGQTVYAYTENLSQGFVANRVGIFAPSDDEDDFSIASNIVSLNGKTLNLVGGFSVNVSQENLNMLQKLTRGNPVGTTLRIQLRGAAPTGKKLKSRNPSPINLDAQLVGNIQDVDLTNRSITIANTKVFFADSSFIVRQGSFERPKIEDLKIGDKATTQVFNKDGKITLILLGIR